MERETMFKWKKAHENAMVRIGLLEADNARLIECLREMQNRTSQWDKGVAMDIKLGQKVVDKVTGFKGVVDHIYYPLHDSIKIGIQAPVGKDGKMGECYTVDAVGVEVLEKKPVVKPVESSPKYALGLKAKDRLTGVEGTIVAYILYLNGCVQYRVQPKVPAGKKPEDYTAQRFPEGSLQVEVPKKAPKEAPTSTGGPREQVHHRKLG